MPSPYTGAKASMGAQESLRYSERVSRMDIVDAGEHLVHERPGCEVRLELIVQCCVFALPTRRS